MNEQEIKYEKEIATKIDKVFEIFELAVNQGLYEIENPIDIVFANGHNQFLGIKDNNYVDILCDKIIMNDIVTQVPFSFIEIKQNIDEFINFKFNNVYKNLFTFYKNFNEKYFNYFYSIYTWEKNIVGFIDVDLKYKKYKILNYDEIIKIKEDEKILNTKYWDKTATEKEQQKYLEYNSSYIIPFDYTIQYEEVKPTNKKELYIINYLLENYGHRILPYIL
jgi:hypothetical protein